MKKRKVSGFYTGLFLLTSVFSLAMIAFVVWFLIVYMQEDIASLRGLSLVGLMLFFAADLMCLFISFYLSLIHI